MINTNFKEDTLRSLEAVNAKVVAFKFEYRPTFKSCTLKIEGSEIDFDKISKQIKDFLDQDKKILKYLKKDSRVKISIRYKKDPYSISPLVGLNFWKGEIIFEDNIFAKYERDYDSDLSFWDVKKIPNLNKEERMTIYHNSFDVETLQKIINS